MFWLRHLLRLRSNKVRVLARVVRLVVLARGPVVPAQGLPVLVPLVLARVQLRQVQQLLV